jgi:TolA-binding protein
MKMIHSLQQQIRAMNYEPSTMNYNSLQQQITAMNHQL